MDSGFSIVERGGVKLISVDCINRLGNYRAYYSTGFGGVSHMPGGCTMNLAMFKKCENDTFANVQENFARFASACGFSLRGMSLHREVHEAGVRCVTKDDLPEDVFDRTRGASDAQVTHDPRVSLFVYAADCCTIMLVDPAHEVSGTTHCGWRNSVNGTIPAFVQAFERAGGCPSCATAALGPSICKDHYSVDADAATLFIEGGYAAMLGAQNAQGRYPIDLPAVNRAQLLTLGIPESNIFCAPWCTWEATDLRLPSYRRDNGLNAQYGGILFHV